MFRRILIPIVTFLVGLAGGFASSRLVHAPASQRTFVERRENGRYTYINPLIECDIAKDVLRNQELRPFEDRISAFLNSKMDKRWASHVSVYFRELNDGLWFSIGDTEQFVPASLRKLPLMIALLRMGEQQSGFLDRKVRLDLSQDYTAKQNIRPAQALVTGREYTVRDLIFRMIVYSDNNAFTQLTKIVDSGVFDSVYATLRMQNPSARKDDNFLSVQTYASFLRVLYNATYLTRESSEWALGVLAQSDFTGGLVEGVPRDITVAHKFGEHSDPSRNSVQLHDCGIVYYPRHPYLLCVMSEGPNFEFLDNVIAEVSRITYSEIENQHRQH